MTTKPRSTLNGLWRLSRLLSLFLLPGFIGEIHAGLNRPTRANPSLEPETWHPSKDRTSRPYLTVSAAPVLRVRAAPPPPNYETEAPPATSIAYSDDYMPAAPPVAKDRQEAAPATIRPSLRPSSPQRRQEEEIPAILPDELRKEIRPEDVIPFFLMPQGSSQLGVSVPVPPQPQAPAQIPSSASYRQE